MKCHILQNFVFEAFISAIKMGIHGIIVILENAMVILIDDFPIPTSGEAWQQLFDALKWA